MLNARLGCDKYQFYKSFIWLNWKANSQSPALEAHTLSIGVSGGVVHPSNMYGLHRLVVVRVPGDFIAIPHWETRPTVPWPDIPLGYIVLILVLINCCTILILTSVKLGGYKYQFYKSSVWLGWNLNSRPSIREVCALPIRSWEGG